MKNWFRRGVVTFVFDDGYTHILDTVVPELEKRGFRGVFAIPLDPKFATKEVMPPVSAWDDWLPISTKGHEIAAHSATHTDLRTLGQDQLEFEIMSPKQKLGAKTFVYPGGAHNEQVIAKTRQHYTAARTVLHGFESIPPKDPYRLKTFNFSRNNFSVLKANILVLWAWLTNAWLIETFHIVIDEPTNAVHVVKFRDFKKHLGFVARMPVMVKTIQDVTSYGPHYN